MKNYALTLLIFVLSTLNVFAQDIYKTPSGRKYHLSSCRMVENVSIKIKSKEDLFDMGLGPCKICKPPSQLNLKFSNTGKDRSVGVSASVQCHGITQKGKRCLHQTKLANGYCYQHTHQNSSSAQSKTKISPPSTQACGARTQSGGNCKRRVKGGGRCYQHQ